MEFLSGLLRDRRRDRLKMSFLLLVFFHLDVIKGKKNRRERTPKGKAENGGISEEIYRGIIRFKITPFLR